MQAQRQQLLPLFQKNEVLFGHNTAPAAIAYEVNGGASVKIYFRDCESLRSEAAPLGPLMLLAGDEPLSGRPDDARIEKLAGSCAFNRLALFADSRPSRTRRRITRRESKPRSATPADAPVKRAISLPTTSRGSNSKGQDQPHLQTGFGLGCEKSRR